MESGQSYFCIASNVLDIFVRIQITCYNPLLLGLLSLFLFHIITDAIFSFTWLVHEQNMQNKKESSEGRQRGICKFLNRSPMHFNNVVKLRCEGESVLFQLWSFIILEFRLLFFF